MGAMLANIEYIQPEQIGLNREALGGVCGGEGLDFAWCDTWRVPITHHRTAARSGLSPAQRQGVADGSDGVRAPG